MGKSMNGIAVALLSILGVIVGSSIQYLAGRTLETRKQLGQQRAQAYADYFQAVAVIATKGRSAEALTRAIDAKTRICMYGSAKAISMLSEFEQNGATAATNEGRVVLARLMREVRRDLTSSAADIRGDELADVLFGPASKRDQDAAK